MDLNERAHIDVSMLSRLGSRLRVHDGHDGMYVVEGCMRLPPGEQDLIIGPAEAVELLAVFGAHGERTHLIP